MLRTFLAALIALSAVLVPPAAVPESAPKAEAATYWYVKYNLHVVTKTGERVDPTGTNGPFRTYAEAVANANSILRLKSKLASGVSTYYTLPHDLVVAVQVSGTGASGTRPEASLPFQPAAR